MTDAGWQSIETAPLDGTIILGVDMQALRPTVAAMYWNLGLKAFGANKKWPWTILDETNGTNGWQEKVPTHWMPLPEPPQ